METRVNEGFKGTKQGDTDMDSNRICAVRKEDLFVRMVSWQEKIREN